MLNNHYHNDFDSIIDLVANDEPAIRKIFNEGQDKLIIHIIKERNKKIVGEVKKAWQKSNLLRCSVCSFDFHKVYGIIGKGFIEAHHITPLSQLNGDTRVVITDLIPVCANCHRMIHRKNPSLSVEEIKLIIK